MLVFHKYAPKVKSPVIFLFPALVTAVGKGLFPDRKRLYTQNSDGQLPFDKNKSRAVLGEIRHRLKRECSQS